MHKLGMMMMALSAGVCSPALRAQIPIRVDCNQVRYTMSGGIGASWHAISEADIDRSPAYKYSRSGINDRGSAWGGNPPVSDHEAWDQICDHASWLGLNWMRVELAMRMYEPARGVFDWDNQEMLALYRILDWAEEKDADVFLQQMWSNVKWNSYPGVQPLISAPMSLNDFADGVAGLLDHLVSEKGYTCIKWLSISNEPPGPGWGNWWSMGDEVASCPEEFAPAYQAVVREMTYEHPGTPAPFTPALKAVRMALDSRGVAIPLSGPDWTELKKLDPSWVDFDPYIGAYDCHSYNGLDRNNQQVFESWVKWAEDHDKPFFLTEMGNMNLGWGGIHPGPSTMNAALSNAHDVMQGLRLGFHAFNRWSFTNRTNLDGQWQLIRTWDPEKEKYLDDVVPEPVAYYGYGIITRFLAKNSAVVHTDPVPDTCLFSQTVISPTGRITTYIVNTGEEGKAISLTMEGIPERKACLYRVTGEEVARPGYRMDPVNEFHLRDGKGIDLTVPPRSINTITDMRVMHDEAAGNK